MKNADEQACYWNGCGRYGRIFGTKTDLEEHLQEHTGANEKFPCTIDGCDDTFERSRDLWNHKWMHKREKKQIETIELKYLNTVQDSGDHTHSNNMGENSAEEPPMKTFVKLFAIIVGE